MQPYLFLVLFSIDIPAYSQLLLERAVSGVYMLWNIFNCVFLGQCLNFTCMFVLVLMLRQSITFLRTRGFSAFLPLDQHIYFHKLTGWFIFGYSFLHAIMHLLNFSK